MKRIISFLSIVSLFVLLILPVSAADLQGGYFLVGDCALGNDLKFYVPADFSVGSLTYDESGYLFNLTSSNIYLYCPDYPDYTIYASRFSGFQYRQSSGSGYQYHDLNLANISDTNVQIFDAAPAIQLPDSDLLLIVVVLLVVLIGCFVILRR